jgi:outer membrane immunogenic protein
MRRRITASVALFAIGSAAPAIAADLRMPVKALPPPMVVSWTGCYIGLNAGGGYTEKEFRDSTTPFDDFGGHHGSGAVGGGQVGCDYQAGMFVFGVQGMFDGTSIKGNHFTPNVPLLGADFTTQVKWYGTATARLGITFLSNGLFYVKGGGAWVRDNFSIFDSLGTGALIADSNPTRSGWVVGFGGEVLTKDGWSMFMEYNYMGFDTKRTTFTNPTTLASFDLDVRQNVQTVTLGINYRFGWAGPVVAKY